MKYLKIILFLLQLFCYDNCLRGQQTSTDDVSKYVWNLAPSYYTDDEAWEKERQYIINKLISVKKLKGSLGKSPKALADGLDVIRDIRWRAQKLSVYGFLTTSVNTKSEKARFQQQTGNLLETDVETAISFVEPELLKIGKQKIETWLKAEPRLIVHKRSINRMMIAENHSLDETGQTLLNSVSGRWPSLAGDAYQSLIESDLGWPVIKDAEGKNVTLDPGTYSGIRTSADSSLVNRANKAFFEKLKLLENVFGQLLTRRIEADVTIAQYRKFDDAIDASFFFADGAPKNTYKKIIQATRDNTAMLQKYFQLRNQTLGINNNSFNNINIPYSGFSKTFSISEAKQITSEVAGLLGQSYKKSIQNLFDKPYFHLPPGPDKRATYGIYQPVGRGNTFMIMNYRNRFNNARAFCGGLFLMQSYESVPKDRLSDTRFDPPIYSNAMIYLGNILFEDYVINAAKDRKEKQAYLVFALDRLWSLFFQWAIMAELESEIQTRISKKEPPTGKQISEIYLKLLRQIFGHDKNIAQVDEVFALDWMNTANVFYNYDHLFWAPAIATSCLLSERIKKGDVNALKAADKILGYSDIDLSYQLLKSINIDLASDEPYQALIRRLNNLLVQLDQTLTN